MLRAFLSLGCVLLAGLAGAQSAIAPKELLDLANPEQARKQLSVYRGAATFDVDHAGVTITFPADESAEAGFYVRPAAGGDWDLTNWGHVTVKMTNTGKVRISGQLRVAEDNPKWQEEPWNTETFSVEPGKSITKEVIFGYSWDYHKGKAIRTDKIREIVFILGGNKKEERVLRIEDLKAAGYAGEKPAVDPAKQSVEPPYGLLFDSSAAFDAAKQLEGKKGASGTFDAAGKRIAATFSGKDASLTIKPAAGFWKLWHFTQVAATLRNPGPAPLAVRVKVSSGGSSTDTEAVTLAAGATTQAVVRFMPRVPWEGLRRETYSDIFNDNQPGTGTKFDSTRVAGVVLAADGVPAAPVAVEILKVEAQNPPIDVPAWVGTRPPVADPAAWTQTLRDEFDGPTVNTNLWNTGGNNGWDKRTFLGPDQLRIRDGKLVMTFEKKPNQYERSGKDPDRRDYSSGIITSSGKWVQRYGYFEARMKLPTCPGLWPAFWMMPDRGKYKTLPDGTRQERIWWERGDTAFGGMEFDILEHLTAWGPYRFNVAFHWDGYEKKHRVVGSSNIYLPADKDGFQTVGLLWLPGHVEIYGQGQLIGRWENPRVCTVPSYPIFYFVSGGWANSALEPEQLPDTFVIDYIRVWQRRDLASDADGWRKQE